MSLLEDIKKHYETENYPPYDDVDCELIEENAIDQRRWGVTTEFILQRGSEYVAVVDVVPATEMQDWGDYGPPEIYEVEPFEVTVTKYRKKS